MSLPLPADRSDDLASGVRARARRLHGMQHVQINGRRTPAVNGRGKGQARLSAGEILRQQAAAQAERCKALRALRMPPGSATPPATESDAPPA